MSTFAPLKLNAEVRDTTQPANLGEHVEQLFRQAVGEVFVLFVTAHVDEAEQQSMVCP
jgi:hypothetical protein